MDELPWPVPSFSAVGHHDHPPALEFMSCDDVPEQWLLMGDDVLDKHDDEEHRNGLAILQPPAPAPPLVDRTRGARKQLGARTTAGPAAISHVEAERQRRDRLNRRFCDLRAAVSRVSRMDKASILEDAVAYIAELRGRVEQLEQAAAPPYSLLGGGAPEDALLLEARMIRPEAAALRLRTAASGEHRHAPARLMAALRALDLPVRHACVCRVGGVTVQDAFVDVPSPGLRGEGRLRAALHGLILQDSRRSGS